MSAAPDWRRMLDATPVRNVAADVARDEEGHATVSVAMKRPWFAMIPPLSWMMSVSSQKGLVLDRLGTEIWDLCDSKRSVEEIVDFFARTHRLSFHESRVAVTGYIKGLIARGALAIVQDKEEGNEG